MKLLFTIFTILFVGFSAISQSFKSLKKGRWVGYLELTASDKLYFELLLDKSKKSLSFVILNGEERVPMEQPYIENDSIHVFFSNFNSELVFKQKDKKVISGRWVNHLKADYFIPFSAVLSDGEIFPAMKGENVSSDFSGKWKTIFSPENNPFAAIGIFQQKEQEITGTFLTETGDFRFLSGNVVNRSIYLSGFDGSHAFLFKGEQKEDGKIYGEFLSSTHYKTTWIAERDEHFELQNPDSLTRFVGDPYDFTMNFTDMKGQPFIYPNEKYKNKVVIVQILGTWCANCMDETVYLKELYKKYHNRGLEIISVGYELGEDFNDHVKYLEAYKKRFALEHTILVGGSAKKSSAREDFDFLSDFTSFPTSIFIDRKGKVVRIHTGFSGPGTGEYYREYKEKTDRLIEQLITEQH